MSQKIKTLLVEYAPRKKLSKTKKLREYFTNLIQERAEIDFLDLAIEMPDFFDQNRLKAYYKRNYLNQQLTPREAKSLRKIDKMRDQFLKAEVLILSSPMYNFGYPAVVKAWIDSVMQKNYVYEVTKSQGHIPKLDYLKVCIIYTSGIVYDQISENHNWNGLEAQGARLFEYMGAEVRVVHVQGVDMLKKTFIDHRTKNLAKKKLDLFAEKWYGCIAKPAM